jgi:hypothetical protein
LKKSDNPRKKVITLRLTEGEYLYLASINTNGIAEAVRSGALLQYSAHMKNPQIAA